MSAELMIHYDKKTSRYFWRLRKYTAILHESPKYRSLKACKNNMENVLLTISDALTQKCWPYVEFNSLIHLSVTVKALHPTLKGYANV